MQRLRAVTSFEELLELEESTLGRWKTEVWEFEQQKTRGQEVKRLEVVLHRSRLIDYLLLVETEPARDICQERSSHPLMNQYMII
jgi:hypothetical protein